MSMYNYLCSIEKNKSIFANEVSLYEKGCIWILHHIFGARYWRDAVRKQAYDMEQAKKYYVNKLDYALRMYGSHVGEPMYSILWGRVNRVDEEGVLPIPKGADPLFYEMGDAEFRQYLKTLEEDV